MTAQQRTDVAEGLTRAMDAPLRSLYVDAVGTWNEFDGAAGRVEAGAHIMTNLSAYAAGTWDRNGPGAEAGLKWEWNW